MMREIVLNGRRIPYELTRKQVKNINLRVRSDGSVHVSASPRVMVASIERFMQENSERILSAVDKASQREALRQTRDLFEEGSQVFYLGKAYCLRVREGICNKASLCGEEIVLTINDITDPILRKKTVEKWLAARCREQVTELCHQIYPYFQAHGVPFPSLRFRFMKTRWGTCNAPKGILTFNCRLVEKPIEAIEYVVAHEFTHFLHCDHSKRFYSELGKIMPDWRARKGLLKE